MGGWRHRIHPKPFWKSAQLETSPTRRKFLPGLLRKPRLRRARGPSVSYVGAPQRPPPQAESSPLIRFADG